MVAIPIPHPSQSSQAYRSTWHEVFSEPHSSQNWSRGPQPVPTPAETVAAPAPFSATPQDPADTFPDPARLDDATRAMEALMKEQDWMNLVAAGSLLAAGALLVSGRKKAGLIVAAAGTAIALIEEKETVDLLRRKLPGYLRDAQSLIEKVEACFGHF